MHVLVVTPDASPVEPSVRDALGAAGCAVAVVASVEEAVEAAGAAPGRYVLAPAPLFARLAEDGAARRRAEAALERTQQLLGIGGVSAALQHEINNPLAALLAHAALLEQGLHEPGEERELLGVIVEQAHRIAAVVKRIAALRYPEPDEFVP